ncbi:hypothetical protein GDO86_011579 [Hymenochirus boettgeri]|uniref:Uncharacterized protein n=1 Tax=Hymenochirus boettgeri TaxID=247094 RepID=A0A8T2JGZ8_9PIPI|nr:hypothetical protein GDO86_011579 [Hymenochirus boettgeri]
MNYYPCHRAHQWSSKPKLCSLYIFLLVMSLSIISAQSSYFNYQIDKRSPDIDPYWYVDRGVRLIGRFGKRQLKLKSTLQPKLRFLLEQFLDHLKKHGVLQINKIHDDITW